MPSDVNRPDGDLSFDEFDDFYKTEQGRAGLGGGHAAPTDRDDGADPDRYDTGDFAGDDFGGDDFGDAGFGDAGGGRPDRGGPLDDFSAAGPLSDDDFAADPPAATPSGPGGRFDRADFQDESIEAPVAGAAAPVSGRGPRVDDPDSSDDLFATLDDVMDAQMVGDQDDDDFQDDFDDEDEEADSGRSLLPMIIALVTVLVFGGLVYFAYTNNYLDSLLAGDDADAPEAVPVVEAPAGPVRERPADRGGLRVSGQSNEALNPDIRRTETILLDAGPEQPMPLDDLAAAAPADGGGSAAWGDLQPTSPIEMLEPVTTPRAIAAEPATAPAPPSNNPRDALPQAAVPQAAVPQADSPQQPAPEPVPLRQPPPPEPAPTAVATAPARAAQPVAAAPVTPQAAAGRYRVQLASMGSQAAARQEWLRLQRQVPDLLSTLPVTIERAEIAGRGTFFRVQAGGMGRADANRLCNQLKGRGLSCLIVR